VKFLCTVTAYTPIKREMSLVTETPNSYQNWSRTRRMERRSCSEFNEEINQSHFTNYEFFLQPVTSKHKVLSLKGKVKQSRYTPWRRLGGEEV
jgi:hypothetical protein